MSDSPVKDYMKKHGIPLTRQNYLDIDHMGKPPAQLSPELEAELPTELQLPKEEEKEMPKPPQEKGKAKPATKPAPKTQGPPLDFGGPILPNPKGIKPMLDTERQKVNMGPQHNTQNAPLAKPPMSIENAPVDTNVEPTEPREQ